MISSSTKSMAVLAVAASSSFFGQVNATPATKPQNTELETLQEVDDVLGMLDECGNLDYTVSGAVAGPHVGLTAVPTQVSEECPILFLDDNVFDHSGKRITSSLDISFAGDFPQYELGTFSLETILEAFDDAVDASAEEYDLLWNNCGTFVISMMKNLEVSVTVDHFTFLAEHLLEQDANNWIISTLRKHEYFSAFFPNGGLTLDMELMYEFVVVYSEIHSDVIEQSSSQGEMPNSKEHRKLGIPAWCYVSLPCICHFATGPFGHCV